MRTWMMAGLALALMTTQAQAWTNNCGSNCPQSAVDNGQAQSQLQQQQQSQNAYGGTASATGGTASATGGTAASNSGGNSLSSNYQAAASSAVVNGAALAGLAASECVLSDTQTAGGALQVMTFGASVVEGTGHTKPYDECNSRAAAPYVAAIAMNHGKIRNAKHPNGVDAEIVYEELVSGLTGVAAAMDRADPATAGQPQTSAVPVAGPVQTASAAPAVNPSCIGANTKTNWYASTCQ